MVCVIARMCLRFCVYVFVLSTLHTAQCLECAEGDAGKVLWRGIPARLSVQVFGAQPLEQCVPHDMYGRGGWGHSTASHI